jgi:translation initiation factor 5B
MIRQPIVSVLGHVDHGKTTLLDNIRGTAVAEREAGGITQHIGATEIPMEAISKICGGLLKQLKADTTLPGLLFIDTPGHEAFTTLRRRGGALADLAILVIDINEGFQPQTEEALNILKAYKTPFLVALNKIDRLQGWQVFQGFPFAHSFSKQGEAQQRALDEKVYELVGLFYEKGFEAERFDRIERFEKQIALVPISAKTGEGLPELLMLLIGLAQKFLAGKLEIAVEGPGKGTILEVKEEVGLGATVDVIIYDGTVRRGDRIVVGGKRDPILTKVRSLLKPKPMDEIRDPKFRFDSIKEVHASSGVKIAAPGLSSALAGSPLRVVEDAEEALEEIKKEIEEVKVETQTAGVIVKADTLGALEALVKMLGQEDVPIRLADVGDISRRDVIEAETVKEEAMDKAVVLGFNVKVLKDAEERARETDTPIFTSNVIYKLIEDYQLWVAEEKKRELREKFEKLTKPAKIKILPGYVFRVSKPAIVGIEVLKGTIKTKVKLINLEGRVVGTVKGLQERNENIPQAGIGKQVAMAIEGPTVGRQINEGEILYTDMLESEVILIETKYKEDLSQDEAEAFEEILNIKRKNSPTFGRR